MKFTWDPKKDESNRKDHSVAFEEASTVFGDPLSGTIRDPDHSTGEERFLIIGMSSTGRLLVVSHTDIDDSIRIISAREATAHERKNYES